MGLRHLEESIVSELRRFTGNEKLRIKDMMEWSTGEIELREGEKKVFLPENRVNVAYKEPEKKIRAKKPEVAKSE